MVVNSPFDGSTVFQTAAAGLKVTFANSCTVDGQTLDLVLTSTSDYTAKYKNNKVIGNMYQMNLKSGTSVTWNFQLVSAGTAQPVEVDNVIFSVLDLDASGTVFQQITADGFSAVAAGEGICKPQAGVFAAMRDGNADDNPTSSMNLDSAQEDSVLSLSFKKVSGWQISMSIPQEIDGGRNFFLAGPTKLMPTTAVCADTMQSTQVPLCPWSPTPAPTTTLPPTPKPTPMPTEPIVVGGACPRGSTLTTTPAVDGESRASWILASNGTVFGSGTDMFDNGPYKTEVYTEYLTGVKAIASGMRHTLFLMENGVVCGRGRNEQESPLCDAATSRVKDPVVVMTGVKSFSTHDRFSIFLKENGDLYGCGEDQIGNLGQGSGSSSPRRTPVLVNANVKSAWAGNSNVLMELLNGSTFVTGSDGWGQFGLPSRWKSTVTGKSHRQEVPMELPPPAGLKPFGAADYKFWYTDAQGTLYGQGMNYYCEMGLPPTGVRGNVPTNPRTAPVVANIKAVASKQNTVFLLKNGTAYTSGDNRYGSVGDGSNSQRCGLYWVMDHVQAVATGYSSSFLLAEDGTVYGSGDNSYFQLGSSSYGASSASFVKILTID